MKRIATLLIWALAAFAAWAADITEEQARTAAANFVAKDAIGMRRLSGRTVGTATKRGGLWLVALKPRGHVFVSASRAAEPIPSFSENDFAEPEPGSPQATLIAIAEANAINAAGTKYESRWRTLLGERTLRLKAASADESTYVDPLLKSSWSQGAPYNDYAPVQNGVHMPDGCVATAYGQIMRYWEWPEKVDEDFSAEHMAYAWGFKQQLYAGTKLNWSEMPLSWYASETDRMNVGRGIMLCGMLAKMNYAVGGSKAQNSDVTRNPWYTTPKGLDAASSTSEELKAAIKSSLKAKCPFVVSIGNPNHSIVGDGYSESAGTFYVHLNYGWGGMDTQDYTMEYLVGTSELSGIYPNQRPKPMVMPDAINAESTLPLTLGWAFPKKGYDALSGFTITYAEVDGDVSEWTDDFSSQQGTVTGDKVSVTTLECGNATPVLHVGNMADYAYYIWHSMFIGDNAELSFRVRSRGAQGLLVNVQLYNPSTGWETISSPALAETGLSDWQAIKVSLSKYANRAAGLRIEALRVSSQNVGGGEDLGVQFDDFKITSVRAIGPTLGTVEVDADARSCEIGSDRLATGKTYAFTVEPKVAGGIASPTVSTTLVADAPEAASIDAIASIRKTGCQVQQGFYREGYLGLNQFAVYGSDAMTGLVVRLSHPALIDDGVPFYDVAFSTWGTTIAAKPIDGAVSVEKIRNGKFLVRLDFGDLTDYLLTTRMIVTFDALDAQGNVARKDFNLLLNQTGGETPIAAADVPDYEAGKDEPGEDEPTVSTYTVRFDANGGSPTVERDIAAGATIASFPTVSWAGHTLDGWFTLPTDGTRIYTTQAITADATYYAHWLADTTPDTPENPDEPIVEPTNGNPNDFSEGGIDYRFCNGVTKTNGFFDVNRFGTLTYQIPAAYNLVLWWAESYKKSFGSYPVGYSVPNTSSLPNDGNPFSLQARASQLFSDATSAALPTAAEREKYFPNASYSAAEWYGTGAQGTWAKETGKKIYAYLAQGPIGILAATSNSRTYGGVIWGCEYADDGDGRYAKVLYLTSTRLTNDNNTPERMTLGVCSVDNVGTMSGLLGYNNGNPGVITTYYPIVGPAISEDNPDEPAPEEPTYHSVNFESVGAPAAPSVSVANGEPVGELPTIERNGWKFLGWRTAAGVAVTEDTVITADVTFYAQWEEVADEPGKPTPDEPSDKIGVADTAGDPGKFYTGYGYTMCDNYWTARKRAIAAKKHLFILSGAAWCSNCSFVKDCLKELGAAFSDRFVVYFSDHDSTTCNYFNGGLPQYGVADPRKVDAFTGTLNGTGHSWDLAWQKAGNGIFAQDRGGYAPDRVKTVVNSANGKSVGTPTNLVIRGLATLGTGTSGRYELVAQFDDGVEMVVDHGVTWSVSGNGTITPEAEEGSAAGLLRISAGTVRVTATSTFYFTGSATLDVSCAPESDIDKVEILTDEVNLEDDLTPTIEAVATLKNGKTLSVCGFGKWSATFVRQIPRGDPELEESSAVALNPNVSVDSASRLTYSFTSDNALVEVCDQVVTLTLTVNGKTATKDVKVWGPTKVAPSKWKMVSGPRQTLHGVVRLQCTELKYNYGGKIHTTTDTYFASYRTVLKYASGAMQDSYLRGLTVFSTSGKDEPCAVGLAATKVNGKFTGYSPERPFESKLSTNFTNVATGSYVTGIAKGEVPTGFFKAFFPDHADYAALADEDSDGDGFKNWEEYVLGTDPTNAGDGLTLMQSYQHLSAPAAVGDTMQYKVMYQQRAYRTYYIDAKKNWSDAWRIVATVSLGAAKESDVTTFTGVDAEYADDAKFFKVRAAMESHLFNHPDDAPVIEPRMLVAAPDAVIDLSDGSTLDLTSFDTDATDAGMVYVKVPANVAIGTALITVPKAAEKSLKACVPQNLPVDKMLVVEAMANGKLALKVAVRPTVADDKGTVEVAGDEIVVKPNAGETEIAVANIGDMTVVLPPAVAHVVGVADAKKIVVRNGGHDITKAMKFVATAGGFAIALDGAVSIKVGDEEIPVRPALADADENPLSLDDASLSLGVKTIPGLLYQLVKVDLPSGTETPVGEPMMATGARLTLEAVRTADPSAFYAIQVVK